MVFADWFESKQNKDQHNYLILCNMTVHAKMFYDICTLSTLTDYISNFNYILVWPKCIKTNYWRIESWTACYTTRIHSNVFQWKSMVMWLWCCLWNSEFSICLQVFPTWCRILIVWRWQSKSFSAIIFKNAFNMEPRKFLIFLEKGAF